MNLLRHRLVLPEGNDDNDGRRYPGYALIRHLGSLKCVFSMPVKLMAAIVALILTGMVTAAQAQQNQIESVSASQLNGNVVIRVALKQALPGLPPGFAVAVPPRIALDFAGTANGSGNNLIDVNQGDLRNINLIQAGERTRMVLNLKRAVTYTSAIEGKNVLITLVSPGSVASDNIAASATPTNGTARFAEASQAAAPHSLRDVDFRRGPDGQGRIIIDLSDSQTGVDIRNQGKSLVIDILDAALPDNLRRRLNVVDFATPVQSINTVAQGNNIHMVVDTTGLWEHNAYQTDSRLVVEVKPVKEDPNKLFPGTQTGYHGERLTLTFQNVDVRSLLQVIADFTNLNIVTSDSVNGNLTLRLKDVPWDQALDIILQSKGLDMRKNGNVIRVAPRDELAAQEKAEQDIKNQALDNEPLRSETFQLNYTNVAAFKEVLTPNTGTTGSNNGHILSRRGHAVLDARTNQMFVTDTPDKLEELRQLILKTDIPTRQVLIEARIVEASDSFGRSLGAKLGLADTTIGNGNTSTGYSVSGDNARIAIGGSYLPTLATTFPTKGTIVDSQAVSLPATTEGGFNPATLGISLFRAGSTKFLNLELSALESEGKGKVLSSPRLVTADQHAATIKQGSKIPYNGTATGGGTTTQFIDAVLQLEVTPQITPEGNVIMTVDIHKDSPGTQGQIDTKQIQTQVLVENGGTVVLGGVLTSSESDSVTKVPFFGDIPYLGNLFKTKTVSTDKTELLIFITPRVINDKLSVK